MTTIHAECVLKSYHAGSTLATLRLRYPKWIHAELMTHRVFSRNASSSRAIPFERVLKDILADPAVPIFWGRNQKGMQAGESFDEITTLKLQRAYRAGLTTCIDRAERLHSLGAHKQTINRLLEPWLHINVVVTSSQWQNFFSLRDHPDAEPHIRCLAQRMLRALNDAPTQILAPTHWHLPFVTEEDWEQIHHESQTRHTPEDLALQLSVARCASVSYRTVDDKEMTHGNAFRLYHKLLTSRHMSPFEHQAQAAPWPEAAPNLGGNLGPKWIQLRKTLSGEFQSDD